MRFIFLIFSIAFLFGCESISFAPGGGIDKADLCGVAEKNDCAPTVGSKVPFSDQFIPIEVVNGEPNLASYLGTVVSKKNKWGEPGAYCGNGTSSPFTDADFIGPIISIAADTTNETRSRTKADIKVDLVSALQRAGVPPQIISSSDVQAAIDSVTEKTQNRNSSSSIIYKEYRIKDSSLKELEASDKSGGRFKECLTELKTDDWRMYQAVTAIDVANANLETKDIIDSVNRLAAAIKDKDGSFDANSIKLEIDRYRLTTANIVADSYFLVIGASFWLSPRHNIKW